MDDHFMHLTPHRVSDALPRRHRAMEPTDACPFCLGEPHGAEACPRVREIEYHPLGGIRKVVLR